MYLKFAFIKVEIILLIIKRFYLFNVMIIDVTVPAAGESVLEATISKWVKGNGDYVEKNELILVLETNKASLEIVAEKSGELEVLASEGDTVSVGAVVCRIDTEKKGTSLQGKDDDAEEQSFEEENIKENALGEEGKESVGEESNTEEKSEELKQEDEQVLIKEEKSSPSAKKLIRENKLSSASILGSGKDGRITKGDVLRELESKDLAEDKSSYEDDLPSSSGTRLEEKKKMSYLRQTIASRLVQARQETAMLTTFNEIDMSKVIEIRKQYKEEFKGKYGVGLGFMSFFAKASCLALSQFPMVNSKIDGDEIVSYNYVDLSIAVSTPKGLVVPVVRDAQGLNFGQLEKSIYGLALRGRDMKLLPSDMDGGTFTITNGGIFGSMLSTPIINYPQSAILGMHNIVERAVVVDGEVCIRPMMYIALSYDHRIVDGKEAVSFLVAIKKFVELPEKILLEL